MNEHPNLASAKHLLRQEYRRRRDALAERAARSAAICAHVVALPVYQQARVLHCYLPTRSEVDTRPLISDALANGQRVVVPVVQRGLPDLAHSWLLAHSETDLEQGVFGTWQPRLLHSALPGEWDVTIVPLLAFDRRGYRLGYGKGYYDRLLLVAPTPTIGVAFATQAVADLPHEPHDVPLDWIVTEDEVIACGQ